MLDQTSKPPMKFKQGSKIVREAARSSQKREIKRYGFLVFAHGTYLSREF